MKTDYGFCVQLKNCSWMITSSIPSCFLRVWMGFDERALLVCTLTWVIFSSFNIKKRPVSTINILPVDWKLHKKDSFKDPGQGLRCNNYPIDDDNERKSISVSSFHSYRSNPSSLFFPLISTSWELLIERARLFLLPLWHFLPNILYSWLSLTKLFTSGKLHFRSRLPPKFVKINVDQESLTESKL